MSKRIINSIKSANQKRQNKKMSRTIQIVKFGLAKLKDDDEQHILFSPTLSCADWEEIPTSSIKKFEYIGHLPCRPEGVEYPFYRLEIR